MSAKKVHRFGHETKTLHEAAYFPNERKLHIMYKTGAIYEFLNISKAKWETLTTETKPTIYVSTLIAHQRPIILKQGYSYDYDGENENKKLV